MIRRSARLDATAAIALTLLCACWGLQQVAVKLALLDGIPPLLQAGLRSAGAALMVWLWSSWRGVRLFERDGSLGAGLLAALVVRLLKGGENADGTGSSSSLKVTRR